MSILLVPTSAIESLDLSFVNKGSENTGSSYIIDKLADTARVVTAISLQNGLSDGSISVDNVIEEFLNFEPLFLKKLENYDGKKVEDFIDKVKSIKLVKSADKEEKVLADMYELKEIWGRIGESINLPDENSYKDLANIDNLKTSELNGLSFSPIIDVLNKKSLVESDVAQVKAQLLPIMKKIEATKGNHNITSFIETLSHLNQLTSIGRVFSIYDKIGVISKITSDNEKRGEIDSDFQALRDVVTNAKGSSFETLVNLISSRVTQHSFNRVYTTGFINGFTDLKKLSTNTTNDWISDASKIAAQDKGIHQTIALISEIEPLHDKWTTVATVAKLHSLKHVSVVHTLLTSMGQAPVGDNAKSVVSSIVACVNAGLPDPTITGLINDVASTTSSLLKKLSALNEMHQSVTEMQLNSVHKLSSSPSNEEQKKLRESVVRLEANTQIISDGVPISTIGMNIDASDTIVNFNTKNSGILEGFTCIKKLNSGFKEVSAASGSLIKIREIQDNVQILEDVKAVLSAISSSSKPIDSIRSAFKIIDKKDGRELKGLAGLRNLSKSFGEAINALVLAKNTLDKSSKFEQLVKNGYLIEGQVDQEKIFNKKPDVKNSFRTNWGNFLETKQSIHSMFVGLSKLIEKIKGSEKSKLEDIGLMLTDLPILTDVDLLTDDRLSAIELFEKDTPNAEQTKLLAEFKKSLLELSKLDLKFSKYQKSLGLMPTTINKLVGVMAGNSTSHNATTALGGSKTEGFKFDFYTIGYIAASVFIVAVCSVIMFFSLCRKIDYVILNHVDLEKGDDGKKKNEPERKKKRSCCFPNHVYKYGKIAKEYDAKLKQLEKKKQEEANLAKAKSSTSDTGSTTSPSGEAINAAAPVGVSKAKANDPAAPSKTASTEKKATGGSKDPIGIAARAREENAVYDLEAKTARSKSDSKPKKRGKSKGTTTGTEHSNSNTASAKTEGTQDVTLKTAHSDSNQGPGGPKRVASNEILTASFETTADHQERQARYKKADEEKKTDERINRMVRDHNEEAKIIFARQDREEDERKKTENRGIPR